MGGGTSSERIDFPGAFGATLAARLDRPTGTPVAYALFAHCFTCSKDVFAAARISRALAERGVAVLRFDFTGLGSSEGEFGNAGFSANVQDLLAAADFLRNRHGAPAMLLGHSLGGAAVLAAAPSIPEARAVVTINAPCDPAHVLGLMKAEARQALRRGRAEVTLGGRLFSITREFVKDTRSQALLEGVKNLRKALLLFHAPRDEVVGVEAAARLFGAAKHPKSFVSLDDADHLLTRRADAVYVADVVAAWASRYLDAASAPTTAAAAAKPGEVLVRETGEGAFAQALSIGRHTLAADEPVEMGGNDSGPTPYDYLLAALGSCTAMTIRMYAQRKRLPLERVAVRLSHRKLHARDCADCETGEGKIDEIVREVDLAGPLDADARARLLEIADKCPVHRTLHGEVKVRTRLAE